MNLVEELRPAVAACRHAELDDLVMELIIKGGHSDTAVQGALEQAIREAPGDVQKYWLDPCGMPVVGSHSAIASCTVCGWAQEWFDQKDAQAASVWHIFEDHPEIWAERMETQDAPELQRPDPAGRL
jgi:hypothetical protein